MLKLQKSLMKPDASILLIDQHPWYVSCDTSYHYFLSNNLNRFYDLILSPEDFNKMVTRGLIPQISDLPIDFVVVPLMAGAMLCGILEKSLYGAENIPIIAVPISGHPVIAFSKDNTSTQHRSLVKYQEYAKSFSHQLKTLVSDRFGERNKLNIMLVDAAHNEGNVSFLVESSVRRILGGYNIKFYLSCVINEIGRNPRMSTNGRAKKTVPEYYVITSQKIIRKSSHLFFLLTRNDRETNFMININRDFPDCYYLWRYVDQPASQVNLEAYTFPSFFKHEIDSGIDKDPEELTGFLDQWRSWELKPKPPEERANKYFSIPDSSGC